MRTISFPKANDAKDKPHVYAPHKNFSLAGRVKSFGYAWSGIVRFFITEVHARIHLLASIMAAILCFIARVSIMEAVAVTLCIALVWITEMINTAIEKTMDFISLEKHPQIKVVKDIAAGAVLIAALTALIVAAFIFIPKIS
jgi:diacylglycerol kinase (ATP)